MERRPSESGGRRVIRYDVQTRQVPAIAVRSITRNLITPRPVITAPGEARVWRWEQELAARRGYQLPRSTNLVGFKLLRSPWGECSHTIPFLEWLWKIFPYFGTTSPTTAQLASVHPPAAGRVFQNIKPLFGRRYIPQHGTRLQKPRAKPKCFPPLVLTLGITNLFVKINPVTPSGQFSTSCFIFLIVPIVKTQFGTQGGEKVQRRRENTPKSRKPAHREIAEVILKSKRVKY